MFFLDEIKQDDKINCKSGIYNSGENSIFIKYIQCAEHHANKCTENTTDFNNAERYTFF